VHWRFRRAGTGGRAIAFESFRDWLLLGVVVLSVGEFIIRLQVMRSNFDGLRLGMAAEIEGKPCGARLTAKQVRNGRSAGRVALQSLDGGAAQRAVGPY